MKLLFLAPSRLSKGDAGLAAELARRLPRARFRAGFVAAPEAVPLLRDLGMPALPLAGATPAENLAALDRVVQGFAPDCLVAADAFALHHSTGWSGLTIELLRERYGRPVASFDRLGWQAAGYTVDFYGGDRVRFPRLLEACDLVIRTSPPHPPGPGPAGVVTAALPGGGLHDGGLRPSGDHPDSLPRPDGSPVVFLVNSQWEYRYPLRSQPAAELIYALPRIVHSHLAALDRRLRVVHVGPRRWRFPVADQLDYRYFSRLPYPMYHAQLAAADLFLTTNALSVTLAQAVLAGVPSLLLQNGTALEPAGGWLATAAPLLRSAYPFRVAPLGWHDLLDPLLSDNPYQGCFGTAGIFDRPAVLRQLSGLLDDPAERASLAQRQHDYRAALAGLTRPDDALRAVTR